MTTCRALVGHLAGVEPAALPLAAGEVVAAAVDQEQEAEVGEGQEQDGQQDPRQIFFLVHIKIFTQWLLGLGLLIINY